MGIVHYLAMTAAEYRSCPELPPSAAWMACLFSPYGKGLSNLPRDLPPGSLLMVSDITPIHGQDPELIARQLAECVECFSCYGILLDLQRPGYDEAAILAAHLVKTLPCPVGVSEGYGRDLDCPVLLPPVPCHVSLCEYLRPWKGREVWLETTLGEETLLLTETGCTSAPLPGLPGEGFREDRLHCHYQVHDHGDQIAFPLWRTEEDHRLLLAEAENWGITLALGLYQEFQSERG